MLFMVIETFKNHDLKAVYKRVNEQGRSLPEGLDYVNSWIDASGKRCFQLMETQNIVLFQQWITQWQDLVDFEVIPVVQSKETSQAINALLNNALLTK